MLRTFQVRLWDLLPFLCRFDSCRYSPSNVKNVKGRFSVFLERCSGVVKEEADHKRPTILLV